MTITLGLRLTNTGAPLEYVNRKTLTRPKMGRKLPRLLCLAVGSPPGRLAHRERSEGSPKGDKQLSRQQSQGEKEAGNLLGGRQAGRI